MFQKLSTLIVALVLFLGASVGHADAFDAGEKRVSMTLGFSGSDYVIGAGAGYFLSRGLELGLDVQAWFGGERDIYEVTPSLTYVLTNLGAFKPYVGGLYRTRYIDGLDNLEAYGWRAGAIIDVSERVYIRAGVVDLAYKDCFDTIFTSCDETYTEAALMFGF